MSWSEIFLAVIAVATALMALLQVGAIVFAGRAAARVERLVGDIRRDVQPIVQRLTAAADDAQRLSGIAVAQAQRVDKLTADISIRLDETLAQLQRAVIGPAREGMALIAGIRAGFESLRGMRRRAAARRDEDDALFIG